MGNTLLFIDILSGNLAKTITVFAFFAILTVIALVDMATMKIPNGLIVTILLVSVLSFYTVPEVRILDRVLGFFSVSLLLLLITLLVPGAFGGGDMKLMAATGLFLGWQLNLLAFVIALLGGGLYGLYLLVRRRKGRKDHFAFGPFLCLGLAIALLWGEEIIHWYWHFGK